MDLLKKLKDQDLLQRTIELVKKEKRLTFMILKHLQEIERRRLYADLGFSSLYEYCKGRLNYSEYEAFGRITAMRLMKESPKIEKTIEKGELTLTNAIQLSKHVKGEELERMEKISKEEKTQIVNQIKGKSTRETREILKQLSVKNNPKTFNIKIQEPTMNKFNSYRRKIGDYSEEDIMNFLLDEKLIFRNANSKSSSDTRSIPQKLKYEVYRRAGGCCEYVSKHTNKRCQERRGLQFDHIIPYSFGGRTELNNLRLYCRAHNQRAAIRTFGQKKMDKYLNN
jgi:hypothetical protein